ncbi:hypothetical protein MOC56_17850, partial [Bacillus inaquosorum]
LQEIEAGRFVACHLYRNAETKEKVR